MPSYWVKLHGRCCCLVGSVHGGRHQGDHEGVRIGDLMDSPLGTLVAMRTSCPTSGWTYR